MNQTNILTSLNVNTQLPLDYKTYVYNLNSLLDLGLNQTKAFSYYIGMKVYCVSNDTTYIWREYITPTELLGLIPNGFIYPNGILNIDYNYSNKKFNFFKYESNSGPSTGNISQFINDVGYLTLLNLPSATTIKRTDFQYTGGSQLFTLPDSYYQVFSVEVQGQGALSLSQYTLITPNKIQINDTLNINDYVVVLYGVNLQIGVIPYYTKAEVDTVIGKNRIFNEVPFGSLNGANATFTSQFNFSPETLSVFLNGMLQKIVSDYNTSLNNTINLVNSPGSTEHILINYTKL